jgi:hypothetical protein
MKRYLPILALFAACSEPIKCLKCDLITGDHMIETCEDELAPNAQTLEWYSAQLTALGYDCRYYDK